MLAARRVPTLEKFSGKFALRLSYPLFGVDRAFGADRKSKQLSANDIKAALAGFDDAATATAYE
jgi:hypothetical protein